MPKLLVQFRSTCIKYIINERKLSLYMDSYL